MYAIRSYYDAEDYDGEVDKLFDFIQDDITSYELKDGGPGRITSYNVCYTKLLRSI